MNKSPCWKCGNRKEYESNANAVRESKARATDYLAARRQFQFTNTAKWGV